MRMDIPVANADVSTAFSALANTTRAELKRHCYRMMGGMQDAEDCVQETLLRGWREYSTLLDPTAGRGWLYAIATRVCLDALRTRRRRQTLFGPSLDEAAPGDGPWIEPWPGANPAMVVERGQDIRLAFVSLLHRLSPQARAVLLLHDGVGMTAAEAAKALDISVAAARSALQRARATLQASNDHPPATPIELPIDAYVGAWNAGDLNGLIGLLHRDIVMTMPPWQRTFIGRDAVAAFMALVWPRHDGFQAIATTANGQPAVALYAYRGDEPYQAHSLHVLAGNGPVSALVLYTPPLGAALFEPFGLAATLPRT